MMILLEFIRKNKSLSGILLFFAIAYSLISLVNHYLFHTYALDLGIYNNALFDYAHFRWNDYSLQKEFCKNPLADHFEIIPLLVSPLYWIFGTYTLLLVQLVAILFGGFGVFVYFKERTELKFLPELAALHFFCIFSIYSALSFDYHGNVVGAMFVPWFLHYFEKGYRTKYWIFLLLILISREHMALWAGFICLGLLIGNLKVPEKRNRAFILSLFSFIYFYSVVHFVQPALDYPELADKGFRHFRYAAFGATPTEMIQTVLFEPLKLIQGLFQNHTSIERFDGIKAELHLVLLCSGGFVFFIYPRFLVMLIPIFVQKLFSDDVVKWGINYHYAIEFAPILSIALFSWFVKWKAELTVFICSGLMVLLTIVVTVNRFDKRKAVEYNPAQTKFYYAKHYKVPYVVSKVNQTLTLIPDSAGVSASSQLVPHLSFRSTIYQYPVVDDASYIALLYPGNTYPLEERDFAFKLDTLKKSSFWELIKDENYTLVFKRK